jgi:hypothetical protein
MRWVKYVDIFVRNAWGNIYRRLHPREVEEIIELSSLSEPPPQPTDTSLSSVTVDIVLNKDITLPNITLRGNGNPLKSLSSNVI